MKTQNAQFLLDNLIGRTIRLRTPLSPDLVFYVGDVKFTIEPAIGTNTVSRFSAETMSTSDLSDVRDLEVTVRFDEDANVFRFQHKSNLEILRFGAAGSEIRWRLASRDYADLCRLFDAALRRDESRSGLT